jgi:oxygen-independent coproporphyrinogen-3 oxidase
VLHRLGRGHDVEQSIRSFQFLRRAGFDNINIDLIFGVPGQSLSSWQRTLESALVLKPEHLSSYCLTIEKDLEFKRKHAYADELDQVLGERYLVDEKTQMEMMQLSDALLGREGFQHYEISNFCLLGFQCRHNLAYWRRGEYLGFGAGAHSFLDGKRFSRIGDPKRFVAAVRAGQVPVSFQEELSPEQELLEEIYLRLRTNSGLEGLDWRKYQEILEQRQFFKKMERLREEGFVAGEGEKIYLTDKGRFLVDSLILELI